MASQYAGWAISVDKFFAMGSGPLRAHARVEKELFEKLGYAEDAERGVLVLEGRTLPTDDVAAWVAQKARLEPSQLTFVVAPTASLAGGVQISARILETGLHKMETLGFDVRRVVSAIGTAPLPPVAKNDLRAIGRTNDCILYGGQARYTRSRRRRRARGAGRQGAGVGVARLRHAVLRDLQALRRRLLQDRPAAVQPGGGVADQRGERTDVPRRGAQSRGARPRRATRADRTPSLDPGAPMRRFPSWLVPSLALAAACGKPADKAAEAPRRYDRGRRPRPGRPAAIVTVIYNTPKDAGLREVLLGDPPAAGQLEAAGDRVHQGRADQVHQHARRQEADVLPAGRAVLQFDGRLKKGIATPGFKAVGDDLAKFATGGLLGMVAVETGDKGSAACPALVTVIYNTPKERRRSSRTTRPPTCPWWRRAQEIGFTRADLTRFASNLDGSAPAKYRQAELCFTRWPTSRRAGDAGLQEGG